MPRGPRRAGAVDGGRVLLDAGAGAVARAAAARASRARELWARAHGRAAGRRAADRRASARCSSALPARRRASDLGALRRLEARGLVAIADARRAGARRCTDAAGRPRGRADRRRRRRRWRRSRRGGDAPAARRHRLGQDRGLPARGGARRSSAGEGVIVLVPEIALTPQTVGRFQARFGDTVALLHSALGEGERYDEWRRLRTGEARIAVGPRSAVFAPVARPRADRGRRGARRAPTSTRATRATTRAASPPSARGRAGARAARRAPRRRGRRPGTRCRACGCRERVDGRPLPPVRVLDMRGAAPPAAPRDAARARRARASRSCCSTAAAGRTSSPAARAGRSWECPQLRRRARAAPRRARDRLPPLRPPRARARSAATPAARWRSPATAPAPSGSRPSCARRSTCRSSASTPTRRAPRTPCPSCWRASHAAPAGLLLGTQMVAKGHDFPDVTLGVVLDADATLRFPDFRAEERTFALIAQLAGRAGRGPRGGRVLVQTTAPDAPAIEAAAAPRRRRASSPASSRAARALRYPPFADLIRVVCPRRGRAAPRARPRAAIADGVGGARAPSVLGPAPLFRLRGRERFQVVRQDDRRARPRSRAVRGAVEARGARPRATATSPSPSTSTRNRLPRRWPTRIPIPPIERRAGAPRRTATRGSTRRRARAATPRCSSCASTATRCCAAARCRVERFDDALREEVRRMGQLMHDALGIGLAATQVGVMHRVLVYRVEPDAPVAALVNPVLEWSSEERGGARGGLPVAARRARRGRAAGPRARPRAGRARRGAS